MLRITAGFFALSLILIALTRHSQTAAEASKPYTISDNVDLVLLDAAVNTLTGATSLA